MKLSQHTLPSGMRLVHIQHPTEVEYFGVAIAAGSADETAGDEGLAHFVEHTIFKGTQKRRAWHILNRMEAVGGELNAYTTKEETMVYTVAPAGHLRRATDLVFDLITNATFPQVELDKERQVVIDEINAYLDTPADRVFDEFDEMAFAGTPLAHNILGTVETVERFGTADCRRWIETHYTPDRMVAFYLGPRVSAPPIPPLKGGATKLLVDADVTPWESRTKEAPPFRGGMGGADISFHQAHTVIGCLLPGVHTEHRPALNLLTNVLGGPGMNALLNVELRERRGLVYSVDASTTFYRDCGLMSIYYGCDPEDVGRCRKLIINTLERISAGGLSPSRLRAACRQYAGQVMVAAQNRENVIMGCARAAMYGLTPVTPPQSAEAILRLTPEAVAAAARLLTPDRFISLTLK